MSQGSFATFSDPLDYIYLCASVGCVVCAALAAGMTMGLLSLDQLKLRIKLLVGSPDEKKAAKQILPLIESHHFLLCTLLLFNAVANEALPVFLDDIVPSWAAVVIAVTAVLICGEILPTALFTGPKQLQIAAKFSGLVYFLQVLFYPVAYPMSLGLDKMLGDEDEENFNRDEISAMMQILRDTKSNDTTKQALTKLASGGYHNNNDEDSVGSAGGVTHNPMSGSGPPRDSSDQQEDPLSSSEVDVITGVLALAKKTIRDVYIPLDKVNMLSSEQLLSAETIEAIDQVGHSRLPVFLGSDTSHILGFLLVKRLITVNPEKALPLVDFNLIQPIIVGADQSLLDVLNIFQAGHSHLALVSEDPEELQYHLLTNTPPKVGCAPIGILSIEDIFEEMLQSEILDEEDLHKGDDPHASLHLREMSMRSSMAPQDALALRSSIIGQQQQQSPVKTAPDGRRSFGSPVPHPPGVKSGSMSDQKRQISIDIVEANTRANARRDDDEGGLRRSLTAGYDRPARNSKPVRQSNHSVNSVVSDEETVKERCLSASASGAPKSYLKGATGHSGGAKITPSMVTKYIRRKKSSAQLLKDAINSVAESQGGPLNEALLSGGGNSPNDFLSAAGHK